MELRLHLHDIPDFQLTSRSLADEGRTYPVLVVRRGDRVTAFLDVCPHAHLPLSSGTLSPEGILCPHHEWTFDPDTGQAKNLAVVRLEPLEVRQQGLDVHILPPVRPPSTRQIHVNG